MVRLGCPRWWDGSSVTCRCRELTLTLFVVFPAVLYILELPSSAVWTWYWYTHRIYQSLDSSWQSAILASRLLIYSLCTYASHGNNVLVNPFWSENFYPLIGGLFHWSPYQLWFLWLSSSLPLYLLWLIATSNLSLKDAVIQFIDHAASMACVHVDINW